MRIVALKEIPDDQVLERDWNNLVQRMEHPQIFYTYQWAAAVQHAYRNEIQPMLFLAYDEDELRGVVAIGISESKTASLLCAATADYCDFVSHPSDRQMVVARVLGELRTAGVENFQLANVPADSYSILALRNTAKQEGFRVFDRLGYRCAQVVLGTGTQRMELRHAFDKKKMFRRNINFLRREAPVTLSRLRSWHESIGALSEFFEAHVARFLATQRISNLVRAERRVFLEELAKRLSGPGWLVLSRLMVGEQAIAWNYGFQFEKSLFWYQPTFDSRVEEHSPGYCLLSKMIIEACDDPTLEVVDLGLGAEDYKERFANAERETRHVTLTRSITTQGLVAARFYLGTAVKTSPWTEKWARIGVSQTAAIRARIRGSELRDFCKWGLARAGNIVFRSESVEFFEWDDQDGHPGLPNQISLRLERITLASLARTAMHYEKDEETLRYCLRAAQRIRTAGQRVEGFALVDAEGPPLHFCWISPFQDFSIEELGVRLQAPTADAAMIFDCWTPRSARGRGYYGIAITLAARRLRLDKGQPWIFSAKTNQSSIRGILKAGFVPRYSMVRRRALKWQKVTRIERPADLD